MSIVKSLSVGDGDMFYIRHNSDSFTILDCCMLDDDRVDIIRELRAQSSDKVIVRFISTHPDDDHIRNLAYLHAQMNLVNFYCVENEATKEDETEDFMQYCALRDDTGRRFYLFRGCTRRWMNVSDAERDQAGIQILWPITTNEYYREALARARDGDNPNNICPIVRYSLEGGPTILWMGDLEADFMDNIVNAIEIPRTDILFAPHHGRDTGMVPTDWLEQMQPGLIIIGEAPSEYLNYYQGYNSITQNSAGDITSDCVAGGAHIYVSDPDYEVDFLNNEQKTNSYGSYYIGTLTTRA